MSSRSYIAYKFLYTDDLGNESIKVHRSYLNPNDQTEDTPTTQLFLNKVINFPEKVTGTSEGLRHLLTYVGGRKLQAKSPYPPNNQLLTDHVEEILAVERVECGDYVAEKLINNGTHPSIQ